MNFNQSDVRPLVDDGFAGEPTKRTLQYIQNKRQEGHPVVGIYCGFAPLELIKAMDATVAVLCAFSNNTIAKGEEVLPANLCPLIKSSYGFISGDTCPFYAFSDVVVAETTCDGKKKMFELISHIKPLHVMDLPHVPDDREAEKNWTAMIRKLQVFLEEHLKVHAGDEKIEAAIKDTNLKTRKLNTIFDYAARKPTVMNWRELYDLTLLGQPATMADMGPILDKAIETLEERVEKGIFYGAPDAPRVLITGCPVAGDATKVYKIIEEVGGVIVAVDSCTGMKPYAEEIEEDTPDPCAALAQRYLKIACPCMTPNKRRTTELEKYINRFKPDVIIDVTLHACHGYNVESHKVMKWAEERKLPFLQIETNYSTGDVGQIRTRVEALLEMVR